ncbi:MAG: hypothetical protein ACHP84_10440 [Caulobacterales bacterium]
MQLTLTASDLAAMPTALRQDLLDYLTTRRRALPASVPRRPRHSAETPRFEGLAVLDRGQAIALLRSVSFGRELKGLHNLLEALAYGKELDAPEPASLLRLLKLDDRPQLRRYFAAIRRRLKSVTNDAAPLMRYSRRRAAYIVHPATRASLREVFAQLARSGEGEEPPWA